MLRELQRLRVPQKKKPEQYGVAKGVEMLDNLLEEGAKQWGHSTPDSALPVVP